MSLSTNYHRGCSWELRALPDLIEKYAGEYQPWLVHELISDSINSLASEPKLGKSAFVVGLATAVAGGHDEWLGRKVYAHGRVLFFLTDASSEREYTKRLEAHEIVAENVTLADGRSLANTNDVQWNDDVDALCARTPDLRLVIIDNLLGVLGDSGPGQRLNDFWTRLQRFNDHGVSVIVLQHTAVQNESGFGKGNRPQGGRSNETSARQVVVFMPPTKGQPRNVIRVEADGNDMPEAQVWYAEKRSITHNIPRVVVSDFTPSAQVPKTEKKRKREEETHARRLALVERMKERGDWKNQRHIADELGVGQSMVSQALKAANHQLKDGKVVPKLQAVG